MPIIHLILLLLAWMMGIMASIPTVPTPTPAPAPAVQERLPLTSYFPPSEWGIAWAIEDCESAHCTHPRTYDLNAPDGGCMQLNKATWANFFLREYGWTWEQVVLNDNINYQAAAIIWERWGRTWGAWRACLP